MEKKTTKNVVKKTAKKDVKKPAKKTIKKAVKNDSLEIVDIKEELDFELFEMRVPRTLLISLSWTYFKMFIKSFFKK